MSESTRKKGGGTEFDQILRGCLVSFVFIAFVGMAGIWLIEVLFAPPIEETTTPLEEHVVRDLCEKLKLSPRDRRCKSGATVYAPDFFADIEGLADELETYDDVEAMFGEYKSFCFDVQGSGEDAYFDCYYDLRGDRAYMLIMRFWADGRLRSIQGIVDPND